MFSQPEPQENFAVHRVFMLFFFASCFIVKADEKAKLFSLNLLFFSQRETIMWKKISVAALLGLSLCPAAATAAGFNPFEGIVDGIAMELATQNLNFESSYDTGGRLGGNVVVGKGSEVRQSAVVEGGLSLQMSGSDGGTAQAVNMHKSDAEVLVMQSTTVTGATTVMGSSNSENSTQAFNLVTACGTAGCE